MNKKLDVYIVGNGRIEETLNSLKRQVYKNIRIRTSEEFNKSNFKELEVQLFDKEKFYKKGKFNIEILKDEPEDYFTILNAGDTVGVDFYRILMDKIDTNKFDMVMGNTVFVHNGTRYIYNMLDSVLKERNFDNHFFEECIEKNSYLLDNLNYCGNKIYSIKIIKKIEENNYDSDKKLISYIEKSCNVNADAVFHKIDDYEFEKNKSNIYYKTQINWDYAIEAIKEKILSDSIKVISFDVFDTLILRPFLEPKDEMYLLNNVLNKYYPNGYGINFCDMRSEAEYYARMKKKEQQEITYDDIYNAIEELYEIKPECLEELKRKEIENEILYCQKRKTAYEIYKFAKYVNKKVIIISDMYLSKATIERMLLKCEYTEIDKYFVSSECMLTKSSGDLYDFVVSDLNVAPENIIHIGDNWTSDWKNSNEHGLVGEFLPRTINRLYDSNLGKMFFNNLPFPEDNVGGTNFIAIRCMLALVANKFFDNPWERYDEESIFNGNISLVGYYALGMNLYGITQWLIEETMNKYDKILFMARDGYLPQKAYIKLSEIYKENSENIPETEYIYISRKALIPIMFASKEKLNMYKLVDSINIFRHSPKSIIRYFEKYLTINKEQIKKICDEIGISDNENFKAVYEFDLFIKKIKEKYFNEEKAQKDLEQIKKYFNEMLMEKTCCFDIGYSARPELILSKICSKKLDAFFINVNEQNGYENAKKGGFNIRTFLNYKPVITGSIREMLISKQAPSCIGYDCDENGVKPIFEKFKMNFDAEYIMNVIQDNAYQFVCDMTKTFRNCLIEFDYYKYYTNIPLDIFINSPGKMDKLILDIIDFEDEVGIGKENSLGKLLEDERKKYNQLKFNEIYNVENPTQIKNKRSFLFVLRNELKKILRIS